MDILIKGIKIPKKCYSGTYCPFFYYDYDGGKHCSLTTVKCLKTKRPEGCPIVALPEHGRLIDADVFWKRLQKQTLLLWTEKSKEYQYFLDVMDMIKSAPTIVEATE